jgi:hypothetical protein
MRDGAPLPHSDVEGAAANPTVYRGRHGQHGAHEEE